MIKKLQDMQQQNDGCMLISNKVCINKSDSLYNSVLAIDLKLQLLNSPALALAGSPCVHTGRGGF